MTGVVSSIRVQLKNYFSKWPRNHPAESVQNFEATAHEAVMERHTHTAPLLLQTYQLELEMEAAKKSAETLKNQIAATEKQLQELKNQLAGLEADDKADTQPAQPDDDEDPKKPREGEIPKWPLTQEEYNRYGRQMIVSSIGIQG